MNTPNPALVSQRAVKRLPRLALILFCAAYVLPGMFGRDPWKGADISAFGAMINIAQGHSSWLTPTVGGVASDIAPLPYAVGALFIRVLSLVMDPALAARIPFALLLVATLVLTWYSTFHLARTEAAQPLPFAFGGEARLVDYARANADGALLALMATLGLLQLGHETTPELMQLMGASLFLYGLSASPFRATHSRVAALLALPILAASGAPSMAIALAAVGVAVSLRSSYAAARSMVPWLLVSGALALIVATLLQAWRWRVGHYDAPQDIFTLLRLFAWFIWPAWPLSLWTLWRWRAQWRRRHIAVPMDTAAIGMIACVVMGGSDRALMMAVPSVAVLAAFALPTLKRSLSAAIDWFSVCFFTAAALTIWVIYAALQTGVPAQPAANVLRLAPGYVSSFSPLSLVIAVLASIAWLWLVKWRTGRHQHALWKSLVLPASGVALCWLLAMTLWLPVLDYARSYRPLIARIGRHIPQDACIAAPDMNLGLLAALEYMGHYKVDGKPDADVQSGCQFMLRADSLKSPLPLPSGWDLLAYERRPTDRDDVTGIFRRITR